VKYLRTVIIRGSYTYRLFLQKLQHVLTGKVRENLEKAPHHGTAG